MKIKLLKALSTSIYIYLKCDCGCRYEDSFNQPCSSCEFAVIKEIFDDLGIDFNEYKKEYEEYLKENF